MADLVEADTEPTGTGVPVGGGLVSISRYKASGSAGQVKMANKLLKTDLILERDTVDMSNSGNGIIITESSTSLPRGVHLADLHGQPCDDAAGSEGSGGDASLYFQG